MPKNRLACFLPLLLVACLPASVVHSAPQLFHSEYSVSFLGFTVARSRFESAFSGRTFSIKGSLASAGIAQIFDDTRGTVSASGRFAGSTPRPDHFATTYISGRKAKKTEIGFSEGNVVSTVNVPPLKKRGEDWVSLSRQDLRTVVDPISAALVRAKGLEHVCDRTVKMYDGEMRADLVLAYSSIEPVSFPGYKGDAIFCSARFVPVAGYRKGHKSIAYLQNRSKIAIAFAPVGTTGVYAPVYATVGTQIGTITIRARKFEAAN